MSVALSRRSFVVLAAFLIQGIVIGLMFGYGVYFKILETELGWSRTVLSGASSLAFLTMGVLAYGSGRLSDRYGPRWVLTVSGLLTGLAYILMSGMQSPWQLWLFFGCLAGIGLATHDVVTLSTVATWFDRKRGLMTGVVKTGTASGQVFVPLLITALVAGFGWRQSLLMLGIIAAVLLIAIAQMMQRKPLDFSQNSALKSATGGGENAVGAVADTEPSRSEHAIGLSMSEAKRGRVLWTLCAIQFCFFPALTTVTLHMVAHATDMGMTTAKAATILSVIGGSSIAGRLAIGLLLDRLGGKGAMLICFVLLSVALLALLFIKSPGLLYLLAPFYGIAHGGLFTVVSPIVAEYFGLREHGAIFGLVIFFGTLSGASGPLLAGMVYDSSGSYSIAFSSLLMLSVLGLVLAWTLPRPRLAQDISSSSAGRT